MVMIAYPLYDFLPDDKVADRIATRMTPRPLDDRSIIVIVRDFTTNTPTTAIGDRQPWVLYNKPNTSDFNHIEIHIRCWNQDSGTGPKPFSVRLTCIARV